MKLAIAEKNYEAVNLLIQHGADINCKIKPSKKTLLDYTNSKNDSLLMMAIEKGKATLTN